MKHRSAMSMIELVISIVVMGIVVMSLPLILTLVQNNNAFAMQQEAILAAKSKIGDVLTYEWDDKSYDSNASRSFVLDTTNGDSELNRFSGQLRRGHVNADNRRKLFDTSIPLNNRSASAIGSDSGDLDDIDDFNAKQTSIFATLATLEGTNTLDYVFDLNMTTSVSYALDDANYTTTTLSGFALNPTNSNTITNIKTVTVTVAGADQNITLRAFTCNIGESSLLPARPYR